MNMCFLCEVRVGPMLAIFHAASALYGYKSIALEKSRFQFPEQPSHFVRMLLLCVHYAWDTPNMTARELDRARANPIGLLSHHQSNDSLAIIQNSCMQPLRHTLLNLYLLSVSYGGVRSHIPS